MGSSRLNSTYSDLSVMNAGRLNPLAPRKYNMKDQETLTPELIVAALLARIAPLRFAPPVSHVYNPLEYAQRAFLLYWRKYGGTCKKAVFVGMNPGPWGMAQTGIPFGDVIMVRDWLGICEPVGRPGKVHPKRPIQGFDCPRAEVSGQRFWGWAKARFGTPEAFFKHFWVANYCPLVFMEAGGRNRTPDKLPEAEKKPLLTVCDNALRQTMQLLQPKWAIGVGAFAAQRAAIALAGLDIRVGRITHPSPANPSANRGWGRLVEQELAAMGIV
jgi:single-strand selective monofunctional uracil DNA glycosylase